MILKIGNVNTQMSYPKRDKQQKQDSKKKSNLSFRDILNKELNK